MCQNEKEITNMKIIINNFMRRQTPESEFSHTTLSDEALIRMIEANFDNAKTGYREGVMEVPLDISDKMDAATAFYSSIVQLEEGQMLSGRYEARRDGEEPRKTVRATMSYQNPGMGFKSPAKAVTVILYSSTVLAEGGDNDLEAEEGNWEIISLNASILDTGESEPMAPETLMANHFGESGGTDTKMSDAEFVVELKLSREFWNDKALAAGCNGDDCLAGADS
jgi:hypothetical protein